LKNKKFKIYQILKAGCGMSDVKIVEGIYREDVHALRALPALF
jgi:hypothetical protein